MSQLHPAKPINDPRVPDDVPVMIMFHPKTRKMEVNAPIETEEGKKLTMKILLDAMSLVLNHEPKLLVVTGAMPPNQKPS
jgi:hypothetical protein